MACYPFESGHGSKTTHYIMEALKLIKEYSSLKFESPILHLNASLNADINGYYEAWQSDELTEEDIKALRQQIKTLKALIKAHKQLNFTFT